jgi:plastocyanin
VRRYPVTVRSTGLIRSLGPTLILAGCALGVGNAAPGVVEVTVVTGSGEQLAFMPSELRVGAGMPLRMTFRNGSSVAHNLVFTSGISAATKTIVDPGSSEQLALGVPAPGSYEFVCTIHDGMSGRLTVEPASAVR